MVLNFAWLPPEINSARIFAGAGSGSLFTAASAWDSLAADLSASASSFQSVLSGLVNGAWTGPASLSMAAAATPYVTWLSGAAAQAAEAAGQARAAATAFESALSGTVPLPLVHSNRAAYQSLVSANYLGQNTPAIFATEFEYVEMWAQDVGAMLGYHAGAATVASALPAFSLPSLSLQGLVSGAESALTTAAAPLVNGVTSAVSVIPGLAGGLASLGSQIPLSSVESFAQIAMYPASMAMSPIMMAVQAATSSANSAGMAAGAAGAGLVDAPKMVDGAAGSAMKGLGGGMGGLGAGMGAGLGQARLVGAMSVPPTWQGSMPSRMGSAAMSGLGGAGVPGGAPAGAPTGGGMPMMPMPMGGGAGGGGMPGGMMGRGGASPHVQQNRPSVVPRVGVG
ncbi:MAG: PPE family protein [Mycobacterium sp.]